MSLSERIRVAMQAAEVTQVELARACGVKPPSVHGWLTGKAKFLRGENLLKAARALRVSQDWLATGVGDMHSEAEMGPVGESAVPFVGSASRINAGPSDRPTIAIKAVTLKLQAGIPGFDVDQDFEDGGTVDMPLHEIEKRDLVPQCLLSIKVTGESMEPMLYAGDSVVINIADTKWADQGVFAINYDGKAVIKRLSFEDRDWWMVSENKAHKRQRCRLGHCIVVGRVVYRSPSWRL
jgi:phage repressor protein C with HTH and peptisase S24 domain